MRAVTSGPRSSEAMRLGSSTGQPMSATESSSISSCVRRMPVRCACRPASPSVTPPGTPSSSARPGWIGWRRRECRRDGSEPPNPTGGSCTGLTAHAIPQAHSMNRSRPSSTAECGLVDCSEDPRPRNGRRGGTLQRQSFRPAPGICPTVHFAPASPIAPTSRERNVSLWHMARMTS